MIKLKSEWDSGKIAFRSKPHLNPKSELTLHSAAVELKAVYKRMSVKCSHSNYYLVINWIK